MICCGSIEAKPTRVVLTLLWILVAAVEKSVIIVSLYSSKACAQLTVPLISLKYPVVYKSFWVLAESNHVEGSEDVTGSVHV